ncbi:Tim10/DDP family zinc finger-domain-containing protein [Daldinia caldariorum]|uniref:Tim10/DDP family zinc finger-domain-containing protein n=1 Tax=Daldinia caldariorum TaxID=326644 RepID=UPI0020080D97|nr:Tim10/DDP family zinc finger-domain-containing protein [Daldinia caldariorum]KAI1464654.1 Tim10/DDP family zinc finger-domain-containing protein [Daldinia caldariorum]
MDSGSIKAQVIKEVKTQYAVENARLLVEKVNEHCFEKCVPKPGPSLSNSESTCFTQCMEKYMSAWNQVSSTYVDRLRREQ